MKQKQSKKSGTKITGRKSSNFEFECDNCGETYYEEQLDSPNAEIECPQCGEYNQCIDTDTDDSEAELNEYVDRAVDMALENGHMPSVHDLARELGVQRSSLRHYFNSNEDLYIAIIEASEEARDLCFNPSDFSSERKKADLKRIRKTVRYFVTAAETERSLWNNGKHIDTLEHWSKMRKAEVLILPIGKDLMKLHGRLKKFNIITEELALNTNLKVIPLMATSTAVNPLAGMFRISGQSSTSSITGATKLTKETVATDVGKLPHINFTTGCITGGKYKKKDHILQTKPEYIASKQHEISGIIVEIKNNEVFFAKEVMFDVDGSFVEVRKNGAFRHHPNGNVTKETALNISVADGHVEESDPVVEAAFMKIAKTVGVETASLHDVFSYRGPGHHTTDKITQAKMFENGWSLKNDISKLENYLEKWSKIASKKVYVVDSNHDEHIEKAVKSFQLDQAATYRIFLEMSLALMDGKNPLKVALEKYSNFSNKKVHFLEKRERHILKNKFGELALHLHGDIGADGAKSGTGTGKGSLLITIGCANVGHKHSPGIIPGSSFNGFGNGGVWVNGVSTFIDHRMPEYTDGPSSWLNTSTLTFGSKNGRFLRTQVTIINGEHCLD